MLTEIQSEDSLAIRLDWLKHGHAIWTDSVLDWTQVVIDLQIRL